MRGIAKQRKQQAKFGDDWWMTRRLSDFTFYREYTILKSRTVVVEYIWT